MLSGAPWERKRTCAKGIGNGRRTDVHGNGGDTGQSPTRRPRRLHKKLGDLGDLGYLSLGSERCRLGKEDDTPGHRPPLSDREEP